MVHIYVLTLETRAYFQTEQRLINTKLIVLVLT